jgi:hypothetical protein
MEQTKKCGCGCGQKLPLTAFGVNKQAKDGLHYYSKECNNLRQKEWNKAHPEALRASKRRYLDKIKDRYTEVHEGSQELVGA